jgi:hypothetical protein
MSTLTRRTVLTGAAATTATITVGSIDAARGATAADPAKSMSLFIDLSAKLTGIAASRLNPSKDPINIKQVYFDQARKHPAFNDLLRQFDSKKDQADVIEIILQTKSDQPKSDVVYLARSIILMWYLGAWYEPSELRRFNSPNPPKRFIKYRVISRAAYTQGWVWRVAQAHPMGYSEWEFGYWSQPPKPRSDFIGV